MNTCLNDYNNSLSPSLELKFYDEFEHSSKKREYLLVEDLIDPDLSIFKREGLSMYSHCLKEHSPHTQSGIYNNSFVI